MNTIPSTKRLTTVAIVTGVIAAGQDQPSATQLGGAGRHVLTEVITVPEGAGVRLPECQLPAIFVIRNSSANPLRIYPGLGASIDQGPPGIPYVIPAKASATLWASSLTNWYTA